MQAVGLSGTRHLRHAEMFKTVAGAIRLLKKRIVATSAGDNGAVNVWNDKNGKYRCESYQYRSVLDSRVFSSFGGVRSWLKEWLKKID